MPCDIKGYIPAHCFPQCISSLENLCLRFVAYIFSISSVFSRPPSSTIDTSLQLRRDVIFCQAATGALCTLAEQLLTALRSRFNNAGEYQEDSKETSRKWLEQVSVIGVLLHFQSTLAPHLSFFSLLWQKAERTMLEDTKAALLDLDKVTVFFRPLEDECLVANTPVCYQVEGSRQALRVTMYLDSCHFSELPIRLQNGGSLKLHTVLFSRGKPGMDGTAYEKLQISNDLSVPYAAG
ncbi:hypothetical protein XENOCAPTIV_030341 [Xenoophorus captivus]|uniref:Uncharacterized protein n=1 Tax=Xenoophorus captivus TaxID=1517983 RepID=A0ABV0REC4_9TELE